jgi:uncharacterized metal-binding protein
MPISRATVEAVAPFASRAFTTSRSTSVHFRCGGAGGVGATAAMTLALLLHAAGLVKLVGAQELDGNTGHL